MKLSKIINLIKSDDTYEYTIEMVPTGNFNTDSYNVWITQHIRFDDGMESIQSKIKIVKGKEMALKEYEEISKSNVADLFREWDKNETIKKS